MALRIAALKLLAWISCGLAAFVFAYFAASSPTLDNRRLGLRGLKRMRALETVPMWSTFEPIVRWLGARFAGSLSPETRARMDEQIALAGDFMGLLPEEAVGLTILSTLCGTVAGVLFGWATGMGNILLIGGAALGGFLPYLQITSSATERMKNVNRRLPYAIDLLALGMGAGLDFPGAVKQVVEKAGDPEQPVIEEMTLILQSLQLGRTRSQALQEFGARCPSDSVLEFVGSVVQAEERGNPIVDVLNIQAEVSRRKRSVNAEVAATKAGVKMIGPLMLVFVAVMILIVAPIAMKLSAAEGGI
jgi:tight adherence protein C